MNDKQILKKAIEKAEENGFNFDKRYLETLMPYKLDFVSWLYKSGFYYYFIFSHDFAKAIWGKKKVESGYNRFIAHMGDTIEESRFELRYIPAFEYHLQQMVLSKKPLKYIEKNL